MKTVFLFVILFGMGLSVFGQAFSPPPAVPRKYTEAQKDSIRNYIQSLMRQRAENVRSVTEPGQVFSGADTAEISSSALTVLWGDTIVSSVIRMQEWKPSGKEKEAHRQADLDGATVSGSVNISVPDTSGQTARQARESSIGKRWRKH